WTLISGSFAVAIAYCVGQILATISQVLIEDLIIHKLVGSPTDVLLGFRKEPVLASLYGRYYRPFHQALRDKVVAAAADRLATDAANLSSEAIFQCAFAAARKSSDTAGRLDVFRNQYGFCRNMALVSLLSA